MYLQFLVFYIPFTSIPLYRTILKTEEYKRGELTTDFLKRYDILERHKADLTKEKEENKDAALAAAVIHSEYFKSRVINSNTNDPNWKHKLD